jgi:hypothetical protein
MSIMVCRRKPMPGLCIEGKRPKRSVSVLRLYMSMPLPRPEKVPRKRQETPDITR